MDTNTTSQTTATATATAAPAAEAITAAKPSAQNLTTGERARRFAKTRNVVPLNGNGNGNGSQSNNGHGQPASSSAPPKGTTGNGRRPNDRTPAAGSTPAAIAPPHRDEAAGAVAPSPESLAQAAAQPNEDSNASNQASASPAESPANVAPSETAADDASSAPVTDETENASAAEADFTALLDDLENGSDIPTNEAQSTEAWLRELDGLIRTDTPKAIKELTKRLHSVVDQRDSERQARLAIERQVAERTAANADSTQAPAAQQASNGSHPALAAIDSQIQQTLSSLELADRHMEAVQAAQASGAEVPQHLTLANGQLWMDRAGKPVVVTPEQIRSYARQYQMQLSQLNARRETTLSSLHQQARAAEQESLRTAQQAYPWLGNRTAPEYQEAVALLRQRPGLRNDPQWPVIVGDYIAGKRAREAAMRKPLLTPQAAPMAKPRSNAAPPAVVTQPASVPASARPGTEQKAINEARERYHKTGSVRDRAALNALERRQRSAA
jgi:hypothetical protein